jgi:hypothetical protein
MTNLDTLTMQVAFTSFLTFGKSFPSHILFALLSLALLFLSASRKMYGNPKADFQTLANPDGLPTMQKV